MSKQWIRRASLTIDNGKDVIDLSDMHFKFGIVSAMRQSPNTADVRIYNLKDSTAKKVIESVIYRHTGKAQSPMTIQAGYKDGQIGVIFKGETILARKGRESPVDTYLDLTALDGDTAYSNANISVAIADGTTLKQRIILVANAMKQYGVTFDPSKLPKDLPKSKLPRGIQLHGTCRKILMEMGEQYGFAWSINGGELTILKHDGYVSNPVVELNSATGLIGLPEQTQGGIIVRCLINPAIKLGGRIKVNQKDIQNVRLDTSWTATNLRIPNIANDGIYKVLGIQYTGDTRGNEWYQTLICMIPGQLNPATAGYIQ